MTDDQQRAWGEDADGRYSMTNRRREPTVMAMYREGEREALVAEANSVIMVELKKTDWCRRWPCAVCNGHTDKDDVNAEFSDSDGDTRVVCAECLKAGADQVPARLRQKADSLEAWAGELRALADRGWVLPSLDAWIDANQFGTPPF